MKIELKPYKRRYFFKFVFGIMDFKALKNLGFFNGNILLLILKKHLFLKKKSFRLMIYRGKNVLGGISVVNESKRIYRFGLFVFKKYRNKGVGTQAVKELLRCAKKKNWKRFLFYI